MFTLKKYQQNTLDILRNFLEKARLTSATQAFKDIMTDLGNGHIPYQTYGLGDIPYICLRLPTGGGKTILASYAIKEAANAYLEQEYPLVIWMVPTTTIKEQTLEALNKPGHPYRQALDEHFNGKVAIYDIKNVCQIRPTDLINKVCIVVTTLASLRVDNIDGRRIYDHNEDFQDFFQRIKITDYSLDIIKDGTNKGKPKYSFANLCHINHPLIIMDEAHNARTNLTYDTLSRLSPACVIEFTATPNLTQDNGSNVLYSVSATELKTENMIKLPIKLVEHKNWQEAVHDAILMREKLAKIAEKDSDFIRPIVLLQAENKNKDVTVDVLKQYLLNEEKILESKIAVATGAQRELDGVDLFSPNCMVEYIITIEALKEGWDCSFAYVFCSVSNISSSRDIEQLLGRILRMPYAESRSQMELNMAYAFVSSPSFAAAASSLRDNLVHMGFEDIEAKVYVQPQYLFPQEKLTSNIPVFDGVYPLFLNVSGEIDESVISSIPGDKVQVTIKEGETVIEIRTVITTDIENTVLNAIPAKEDKKSAKKLISDYKILQQASLSPAESGKVFSVPRLGVMVQQEFNFADYDLFLEAGEWDILNFSADFSEEEFFISESAHVFEVNLEGRKVKFHEINQVELFGLEDIITTWKDSTLIQWLDKKVRQPDIGQMQMLEFLRRCIKFLLEKRNFSLGSLVRCKYLLVKAIINKINISRCQAVRKGFQKILFGNSSNLVVKFDYCFKFKPDCYPAKPPYYSGGYTFQKHFYPIIGDLKAQGEEFGLTLI